MTPGWKGIGSAPLHHKPRKITPAQRDEIRQRYADGETSWALAAEFGVTAHTVQKYVDARRGF